MTNLNLLGTALANRRVVRSQAMTTSKPEAVTPIKQNIEDAIRRRTGRRIEKLDVQTSADCVLVRGCAPSYYVGQLALCGVWDVVGRASEMKVRFEVHVSATDR
jgi:hypothetical protein